ncbi:MAG: hypothetical protein PHN18_03945 [Sulfurospirillaceae bacterium]|nr:hypothetical protein [Sulfurospirillaceae bacterium]MDD2825439.1 hypothetical protein [Sulfurospirillaceae bacterium]
MKSTLLIGLCLLLLSGCSTKPNIVVSQPYLITIKNTQIALSDTGFINFGKDYANVQIFSAGAALFNLEASDDMCVDGRCTSREQFNTMFFNHEHYATLMDDLLHMQPIYQSRNLKKIENGFEQEIILPKSHITYRVINHSMTFRDSQNGIMIKLKPLQ